MTGGLFYESPGVRLYLGDVRECLRALPDERVHTVVTSPPYWGLRDYGTATWEGGDAACDHLGEPFRTKANVNANCGTGTDRKNAEGRQPYRDTCGKCGARRIDRQIGLEATPDAFVAAMVDVFREVRRVLRDDATAWVNLGDSYAAGGGGAHGYDDGRANRDQRGRSPIGSGLKPKDLCGIPWRVAFALQADGWYLRSDIIWAKPNPMPESVTDRPTKAHEYVFLLSKSPRYYYDADAIREPASPNTHARFAEGAPPKGTPKGDIAVAGVVRGNSSMQAATAGYVSERNKRTVWTVATEPYPEAHFATFPTALVTPCILAGAPVGGVVLDPFVGSGTTGQVARELGREFIGIDLNPEYLALAVKRIGTQLPMEMSL